jgi:hypothetical protein
VFSSKLVKLSVSFVAAIRGHNDQKLHRQAAASASTSVPKPSKIKQQGTGQSVPAPVTVVQQIITDLKGAVSEQAKIFTITKTVFNLMKEDGKYSS